MADTLLVRLLDVNAIATGLHIMAIIVARRGRRLAVARFAATAEYLANTDVLAGLSNRRPLIGSLQARNLEGGYVVAIGDLEPFKTLNDTFGHQCGHQVPAEFAGFKHRLRAADDVGRGGGEEFDVGLPHIGIEGVAALMERLREDAADMVIPCAGHNHRVTISIGDADGAADNLSHRVLKRADDALYDAKVAGCDTVRTRGLAKPLPTESHQENPRASRIRRP